MTIKAIAVKANFVNSAVASAAFDIEAPTKLGTPVISVDSYNHNSIAFSWAAVDNATGYQVSTDGGSSWLTKQEETSYTWTGLSASTSYTIKVKAIGTDNGQYTDSDVASKSQTTSAPVTLVSIALTTAPTKTTYNVGETFSFAGAVVTATYSDANTADVTASCTTDYDGVTFSSTGVKTVTVSYTEGSTQTTTFNVTVAIVDVLTNAWTGISSTSYSSVTGLAGSGSDAVYSVQAAGGTKNSGACIQIRTTNSNSGIVTTTSGGTVKKVTVTWNSETSGKTLDVYGKNTAYSAPSDLYNNSAQGTKIGSIASDSQTELTVTGDYEYIGLRSNSGAMYIDQIEIEWAEGDPTIAMAKTSISGVEAAGVNNASEGGVYTFKGGATDADVTVTCDGEIVTSASKNNGSLTYTVAANTGTAREGWIKVQYASESAHTVTVSQNAATYTLTLSSGGNGTVAATVDDDAVASSSAVAVGKTVTITASPSSGYVLDELDVYKTGDSSTKVTVTSNSFTMPAYAVTVSATFVQSPTITMNTTSITDVAAAGGSFTATSAYTLENGASNDDVEITCDGCVTAASKAATAGNISYTVEKNTGAAREGHIYVKYSTEAAHTITVSQVSGSSTPDVGTVLFAETFGSSAVSPFSSYTGTGSSSYNSASTLTYTCKSTNTRIMNDTQGNCGPANLLVGGKNGGNGEWAKISGIKTYGATKVTVTWASNNIVVKVSIEESSSAAVTSANSASNSGTFTLSGEEETITLVMTAGTKNNGRVDTIQITVAE